MKASEVDQRTIRNTFHGHVSSEPRLRRPSGVMVLYVNRLLGITLVSLMNLSKQASHGNFTGDIWTRPPCNGVANT